MNFYGGHRSPSGVTSRASHRPGPEADEPSSLRGVAAAWAGSIALHAGVILGVLWAASWATPAPRSPTVLHVAMIETARPTPPEIRPSHGAGLDKPRTVTKPTPRVTPLTPSVLARRAREITTVRGSSVQGRPGPRFRNLATPSTSQRQHSVVPTRHGVSLEPTLEIRQRHPAPGRRIRPARREAEAAIDLAGTTDRRSVDVRTVPPQAVKLQDRPIDTRGFRVLQQAAVHVRAPQAAEPVSSELRVSGPAETRTPRIVESPTARRVSRIPPDLARLPHAQLSTVGSVHTTSDYGWLAEAMRSRIAQLKRYPHVARVNRWEGRVVLRAVIRDDGELAALNVRTSSGHRELDEEAMKLVRQVCPVPLKHSLGRSEITMHIPISYTLDP